MTRRSSALTLIGILDPQGYMGQRASRRSSILLEMALGGKFQANQADGTRTEPFSKAMFLKLNTQWPQGANPRSGRAAPGTASSPALFSDRGVTV